MSLNATFAGRQWFYSYKELPKISSEEDWGKIADRLTQRYVRLAKQWNEELNSQWTCRFFMAAKLIMSATLKINAADYAEEKNLRVVVPYLHYYAVFSLLRAVCYTLLECQWDNGKLITISHSGAIKGAMCHLSTINKDVAKIAREEIEQLKAQRELISYRAPSSGDDQVLRCNRLLDLCSLLAELAQFNSELMEKSLERHGNPVAFKLLEECVYQIANVTINNHTFSDREDAYRLGYFMRKQPLLANLQSMMTEGHVDDFFGAWAAEQDNPDQFDPDEMKQIIFDIP